MEEVKRVIGAMDDIVKAVVGTVVNGVSEEEVSFRRSKCESCPLSMRGRCSSDHLASEDDLVVTVEEARKMVHTKVGGVLRTAVDGEGRVFYRGCGCRTEGELAKYRFYFSEKDLRRKDGTGPCPMGKWLKS